MAGDTDIFVHSLSRRVRSGRAAMKPAALPKGWPPPPLGEDEIVHWRKEGPWKAYVSFWVSGSSGRPHNGNLHAPHDTFRLCATRSLPLALFLHQSLPRFIDSEDGAAGPVPCAPSASVHCTPSISHDPMTKRRMAVPRLSLLSSRLLLSLFLHPHAGLGLGSFSFFSRAICSHFTVL